MPMRRISSDRRAQVAARANGYCEYCKSPERFSTEVFSVDHVLPRARGGTSHFSNLAFACQGCNSAKYDHISARDPASGATVSLFNPRAHLWASHFRWNRSFKRIIGITATGRATIITLELNRDRLQNLRELLRAAKLHPPQEPVVR